MTWHQDHANIVILTAYMAKNGYTADEVAYAVEKPWKHEDVFTEAKYDADVESYVGVLQAEDDAAGKGQQ